MIFSVISPVIAAQTTVYAFELINRMGTAKDQQYDLLWQDMRKQGVEVDLQLKSFTRYKRAFKKDTNSCIFPANLDVVTKVVGKKSKAKFISAESVDYVGLVAITEAGDTKIETRADLAEKNIAISPILNSSNFLQGIDSAALKLADNNEVLLKMLYRHKVDAIIAFMPDILLAAKKLNYPLPHSTDIWFIKKHPISIVCHDTANNRIFVQQFNKQLQQLKKSGRLREIMGPLVNLGDGSAEYY
ncbi:MAG: transporter substrate-binding domain-containing protein [Oceanospirillaceae bacterium]|nr:transporter substrate-binding domain-containing protein [Oceanospirillaceae bacterium]